MIARIRKSLENKDEGFTLIELLVVIIITGILAAIAVPVFLSQRKKGYDAQTKSDLRGIATAEESYLTDNNVYLACASATACQTSASLGGQGLKLSSLDKVAVYAAASGGGYCAIGLSQSSNFFYYDTGLGGLQSTAPSTSFALPTGGICASSGFTASSPT